MEEIAISEAGDAEAAACLALLPEVAGLAPLELLIARRGGRLAGAAAIQWRNTTRPPHGFPLLIHVLPGERRRGVGSRLLEAAIELAWEDADGLWSLSPASEGSDPGAFLLARGFEVPWREHHFEAEADVMLAALAPMAERLRNRNRMPDDLRIVPLAEAPLEPLVRLLASALGSTPSDLFHRLERRIEGEEAGADRSRVALLGGKVEGAVLWRVRKKIALVEAWAISPGNRWGGLSALLLEDGLMRGRGEGLKRLRFHCDSHVTDTLALAALCGARQIEIKNVYYRRIAD